jgi:hypothetical protein
MTRAMTDAHVFAAIEQAQQALALYKMRTKTMPKEAHRAMSVVATKLDEARMWFSEGVDIAERAVAKDEPSR